MLNKQYNIFPHDILKYYQDTGIKCKMCNVKILKNGYWKQKKKKKM